MFKSAVEGACEVVTALSVTDALDAATHPEGRAQGQNGEATLTLVCGSFYVVASAREQLARRHPLAFPEDDIVFTAPELRLND